MNVLRQRTYLVNGKEPSMWWRHGRTVRGNDASNSLRPAGCRVCWTKTTSKHSPSSSSSIRWTSSHRLVATPQSINSGERCDYDQFTPTNVHRNLSYTNAATTRMCRANSDNLDKTRSQRNDTASCDWLWPWLIFLFFSFYLSNLDTYIKAFVCIKQSSRIIYVTCHIMYHLCSSTSSQSE